jgi:uncharacterized protein YegP (UPF0339 family)
MDNTIWTLYQDERGQWRWKRQARNGQVIAASTEGYHNRADMVENAVMSGYVAPVSAFKPAFGYAPPAVPDPRNWPVSRLVAMIEEGTAAPVSWSDPVVLDQGQTPHCVGFAGAAYIATAQANAPTDSTVTNQLGHDLYRKCKVVDRDPLGENGSSIHSLMVVLKEAGIIDAYAFASTLPEIVAWLERFGPVLTGLSWTQGMCYPVNGIMHRTGTILSGHATEFHGITNDMFDVVNSWSLSWGLRGHGHLPISECADIVYNMGEIAMAVKKTAPAPPAPPPPVPPYTPPVDPHAALPWPDLPEQYKAAGWVVKEAGLFEGYDDGTFHPDEIIQLAHVALVMGRAFDRRPTTRLDVLRMLSWWLGN